MAMPRGPIQSNELPMPSTKHPITATEVARLSAIFWVLVVIAIVVVHHFLIVVLTHTLKCLVGGR